jgi:hypothetical protein
MTAMTEMTVAREMTEQQRNHLRLGFRSRVIGLCAVLLLLAAALGLLAQRTVLRNQLDRNIDASLEQERSEIEQLAAGLDPATGEPFGDECRRDLRDVPGPQRAR